jgi:hypothetical protein
MTSSRIDLARYAATASESRAGSGAAVVAGMYSTRIEAPRRTAEAPREAGPEHAVAAVGAQVPAPAALRSSRRFPSDAAWITSL